MTVAELIEKLREMPQEVEVVTFGTCDNSATEPEPEIAWIDRFGFLNDDPLKRHRRVISL